MGSISNDVVDILNNINVDAIQDPDERAKAADAAEKLVARLQTPWQQIHRLTWLAPAYVSALKICVDSGLFDKWKASGGNPQTVQELSSLSGIEKMLLVRVLQHVAAMNGLVDLGDHNYALTPFTESLAGNGNSACFRVMFESTYPAFLNLPSFLSKTQYKNPTNLQDCNWQDVTKAPETYYQYIGSDPDRGRNFQDCMVAYNTAKASWMDFYPTDELLSGLKSERVVLVDAGGGHGFDLEQFQKRHSGLPDGSLVLQDLPPVVADVKPSDAVIKVMAHDLTQPQPVKGARAYFTHVVFHGFPDSEASTVLQNFADAMEPGYSKLLLHEKVVDSYQPSPYVTGMDVTMMALFAAHERSEKKWRELTEGASLKINKIIYSDALFDSIIEAELA